MVLPGVGISVLPRSRAQSIPYRMAGVGDFKIEASHYLICAPMGQANQKNPYSYWHMMLATADAANNST